MSDTARFLREFARDPWHTASVAPSSAALAAAMTAPVPPDARVVVELGPGSGAFTRALHGRTGGRTRHLAVELNPRWAALIAGRHPGVEVLAADARELPRLLAERGIDRVDALVSGLPWAAAAPGPGRPGLFSELAPLLAPDGVVTQFGYAWTRWAAPARALLADLRGCLGEVTTSPVVWRNLPPAVVHRGRTPRH